MIHHFRVWAPDADRVDLVLDGGRRPLRAAGDGWFESHAEVVPGARYQYALDDGPPLPDPRSQWQPDGPHGPSAVVDHAAFGWSDDGFTGPALEDSIFYELHLGTFSEDGTFAGAIGHLDHIADLGVTTVEVMPVAEFPGDRGWGYDGVDLFAAHHSYGGADGFKRFVDACHARGLAVVLDVVYNHLGPDGNYLSSFGPYFTDRYSTPWGAAVNFDDHGSDEVRAFVVDNALGWLREFHVDGLRLDAVHAFYDRSAVHVLEQLSAAVDALAHELGKPLFIVAESDLNDPRLLWRRDDHGYGVHGQWSDDFHHALHAVLTGERDGYYADFGSAEQLARALTDGYVFTGQRSRFRGRRHGRPLDGVAPSRLVGYAQNHDQIGNRAAGERLAALVDVGILRIAAALVLLGPSTPLLFQGEEWASSSPFLYFTDHTDPELARAVSEGRRREFERFAWAADVPDPQDAETFARSRLDWSELARPPHDEVLAWHRHLCRLRRNTPALRGGAAAAVRVDERAGWLVMERGPITVAANFSDSRMPLPTRRGAVMVPARDVFVGAESG